MLLRKIKGIIFVLTVCFVFLCFAVRLVPNMRSENASVSEVAYIIDAGHGKPDGGAVANDGTEEQQINLAITKELSAILTKNKISHLLTRSDDESIYTDGETIHEKKVSDIRKRVEIADSNPSSTIVSIHMNSFPDENVHGVQVFYRDGDPESKELAAQLQTAFNERLQAGNRKTIKPISSNIYLFSHTKNSAILIECGFLSNSKELEQLKNTGYQKQLASIIAEQLQE